MKHILSQKHFQSQLANEFSKVFDESSNLRKLFKNSSEFEFTMSKLHQCGPLHERINQLILLKNLESILSEISKEINIKPIEDGYVIHTCSPNHIKEELPIRYPTAFIDSLNNMEYKEMIDEGPLERVLSNVLLANIQYYIIQFLKSKE